MTAAPESLDPGRATTDDLDAAVVALRTRYPDVIDIPIAVPTNSPAGPTVRFLGTITSDHHASVLTIVDINNEQVFEVSALADPVMCTPTPVTNWETAVIRDDTDGCTAVPPPGGSEFGQWTEDGQGWWYRAQLPASIPPVVWLAGLHLTRPS